MTDKCMCAFSSPYICHYCVDRMKVKLGFCPHDDPAWCDDKCETRNKEAVKDIYEREEQSS